ncbi:4-alpha-glucanotransferase [Acinetobacter baumannii]|uniref:4-alpha-glucanotransferase n=1 Tax=Acinetobacter baumannii TaxID=470 RepID=UPI0039172700
MEAWRHQAVILGEDLGTIPHGFRDVLAAKGILGMRVLLFEQHDGHFQRADQYSDQALAPALPGGLAASGGDPRRGSRHHSPRVS